MKTKYFIIILSIIMLSCTQKPKQQYDNEDGIFFEKFEETNTDENKYNNDNVVYTVGKKYTFEYDYEKNNTHYLYQQNDKEWSLINKDSIGLYSNIVTKVIAEIANGNPMENYISNYNQTVIKYQYYPIISKNATGVVENEKNIWMHPPRQSLFEVLELNPFPYIKYPLKVGQEWEWKLKIGEKWGDIRWKKWEGSITNIMNYKITDYRKEQTSLGNLDCYIIVASAKSRIGNTQLTAFFNKKHGFVKLDYLNIDGSTLKFKLIDIDPKSILYHENIHQIKPTLNQ